MEVEGRSRGIGNSFEEEKEVLDTLHGIVLFLRVVQPSPTSNPSSFFLLFSFSFVINLTIVLILRHDIPFLFFFFDYTCSVVSVEQSFIYRIEQRILCLTSSISSFSFRLICHMISILMDACYTDLEEIQSITVSRKSSSDITRIESKYTPSSSFPFSFLFID